MKIQVSRFTSNDKSTLSFISIDDEFECFGLEDAHHDIKVPGETRIPAGLYKIGVRTVGGFHGRYSHKFNDMHRGMLHILDVPGFEYILIHIGNTSENTEGCLLVGAGAKSNGEFMIQSSKIAYKALYQKVIDAALNDDLEIEYFDNDR